ncbi:MAG: peptidyl-alpha-hydroxyglycine alpha-amidating lyase family protein [Isosphaeraceae bacterium]
MTSRQRISGGRWLAVLAVSSVLFPRHGGASASDRPRRDEGPAAFRVDPAWPRRSDSVPKGEVPGIAVDRDDNVYVLSRTDPPLHIYSADGTLRKSLAAGLVGKSHGVRIGPDGDIWIADIGRHVVHRLSPDGRVKLTLGTPDSPGCDETHLNQPTDVAIAPDGHSFITDGYGNQRVVHFDPKGKFVAAWGRKDNKAGSQPGEFHTPHAIVIDSKGRLYVADRSNARIQVFDREGKVLDEWRDLIVPWGLWITPEDEIWSCGSTPMPRNRVDVAYGIPPKDQIALKFDGVGRIRQIWGIPKGEEGHEQPGDCIWVHCLAIDSQGNLYLGDIRGQRAQKFTRKP